MTVAETASARFPRLCYGFVRAGMAGIGHICDVISVRSEYSESRCVRHGRGARGLAALVEDIRHMSVNGVLADGEPRGDLLVGETVGDP